MVADDSLDAGARWDDVPGALQLMIFTVGGDFVVNNEVEFVTVMTFESLQNVIDFQGKDYQKSYVPDAAQKVLSAGCLAPLY